MVQGKFIYQGPALDSIEYFANIGYAVPEFTNPTDYFMDIMHKEYDAKNYDSRCEEFFKVYE